MKESENLSARWRDYHGQEEIETTYQRIPFLESQLTTGFHSNKICIGPSNAQRLVKFGKRYYLAEERHFRAS